MNLIIWDVTGYKWPTNCSFHRTKLTLNVAAAVKALFIKGCPGVKWKMCLMMVKKYTSQDLGWKKIAMFSPKNTTNAPYCYCFHLEIKRSKDYL